MGSHRDQGAVAVRLGSMTMTEHLRCQICGAPRPREDRGAEISEPWPAGGWQRLRKGSLAPVGD